MAGSYRIQTEIRRMGGGPTAFNSSMLLELLNADLPPIRLILVHP
jgi:hypothetical protein